MKILHLPFCFYPDPVGGTEIYVASLAKLQQAAGGSVAIAAPGQENQHYFHEGLEVFRYQTNTSGNDINLIYGKPDPISIAAFKKILLDYQPTLVHFHAHSPAIGLGQVQAVKEKNIKAVFTYHTPTVTCQRGTLLRWGKEICTGKMQPTLCTSCVLQEKGLPKALAWLLGHMPAWFNPLFAKIEISSAKKIILALRMHGLVSQRQQATKAFLHTMDHTIAVCDWVEKTLLINGINKDRITLSRQGLTHTQPITTQKKSRTLPVKLVFLGRLESIKGIHLIIQALQKDKNLPISLDIYGIVQSSDAYQHQLLRLINHDPRIQLKQRLFTDQVIETLQKYDFLVVPSQWLETGPLVVLEAFAAGIPVLGSALGGIKELVKDQENGLLVEEWFVSDAWYKILQKIVTDKIDYKPPVPKTMAKVNSEANQIYSLVKST